MGAGSSVAKANIRFDNVTLRKVQLFGNCVDATLHNLNSVDTVYNHRKIYQYLAQKGLTMNHYSLPHFTHASAIPEAAATCHSRCSFIFLTEAYLKRVLDSEIPDYGPVAIIIVLDNASLSALPSLPQPFQSYPYIDITGNLDDNNYLHDQLRLLLNLFRANVGVPLLTYCLLHSNPPLNTSAFYQSKPLPRDIPYITLRIAAGLKSIDPESCFAWCKLAAESLLPQAQYELAQCYYNGIGVKQNYKVAVDWLLEASNQAYCPAWTLLGECYLHGRGVAVDTKKAMQYYQAAADEGEAAAIYSIAQQISLTPTDESRCHAKVLYAKAAILHYSPAEYALGECYHYGRGVGVDIPLAQMWYQRAATAGYAPAMCALGKSYIYGWYQFAEKTLSEKQIAQGLVWLNNAVSLKHAESMFALASYYAGKSDPHALVTSLQYMRSAAKLHHCGAQYSLGICYLNGVGVVQDECKAFSWLCSAAVTNHVDAQYAVGRCYMHGIGVFKDVKAGVNWYRRAADKGHVAAQRALGEHYLNSDEAKAKHYLEIAGMIDMALSTTTTAGDINSEEPETNEMEWSRLSESLLATASASPLATPYPHWRKSKAAIASSDSGHTLETISSTTADERGIVQ